jgi:hypothetical protein
MRRLFPLFLSAFVALVPFSAAAASGPVVAGVVAVQPSGAADLVLIDRGFDAGLRQGMVCRVTRGATDVAEVLLVGLRPGCSAALIVSATAGRSIRAGDTVAVKLLKS